MWCVRFLILILVAFGTVQAQPEQRKIDYGLAFSSHETSKDHRTSLNLNPEVAYTFTTDFTLEFDLAFQRLTNAYGYIVRIIANDSLNIDLVSSPDHQEFSDLTLIINNKPTNIHFEFSDVSLEPLKWTSVKLAFALRENKITLSWNGHIKSQEFAAQDLKQFQFYFGSNDTGKFMTSDAPPIILKDIALKHQDNTVYKWTLNRHNTFEVYDSISNQRATVTNPTWIIDKHTRFVHRKDFVVGRFPSIAFDGKTGTLFVMDEHRMINYNVLTEALTTNETAGTPIHTDANQLLYIEEGNRLVNYDLYGNKVLNYDPINHRWPHSDTTYHEPNNWHNNKFYNPFDKSIYSFGGYGFFTYKNNFYRFDTADSKWDSIKTSQSIPPRYLAAAGLRTSTNEVLIFGGYGSMSGKQELSPQSFVDLYSFNLQTHEVKKLWDTPPSQGEDMVFSNSLVVNEKNDGFYVMSFPKNKYESSAKLRQYALDNGAMRILADSIPFKFHDEHSFCDLFLCRASNELIAVTVHKEKNNYQVHVYSINYPPLQAQDVFQEVPAQTTLAWIVLIPLAGIGLGAAYFFRKRLRKKSPPVNETRHDPSNVALDDVPTPTVITAESKFLSTVLMFGDFQVFDKQGNDITGKFTMTLKELFTLILIHSVKFENGISTTLLQEFLWPDKDELSARNNRNVNIKKLRTLLEEIGDITIENNNSYLRLDSSGVFFDYDVVFKLLNNKLTSGTEAERIITVLKNVRRGSLLPNMQKGWLDNFKSEISNQIIDTLLEFASTLDPNKEDKLLLEIADTIFKYDTINQEALVIKCSVLNKKGKYSLAKSWYDHFVKEYKNLYAENYPKSFEEVIAH